MLSNDVTSWDLKRNELKFCLQALRGGGRAKGVMTRRFFLKKLVSELHAFQAMRDVRGRTAGVCSPYELVFPRLVPIANWARSMRFNFDEEWSKFSHVHN